MLGKQENKPERTGSALKERLCKKLAIAFSKHLQLQLHRISNYGRFTIK